jgi:septal ring factor EnvC (AmiA/AmiB activator)
VRSIYHGRVVYSDWLPGLGLLLIVDHGEGFMSLYGYNEALLKESGDWVAPGEVIAQVGDSGGQSETALYFEIRQDGEPTDPRRWLNGDPPRRR